VFVAGGRCPNPTTASARAVFASLRALFSFIQLLLFNSPQIMIVSKDLKLKSNSSIHTGGREGEGVGEEREGDVLFFPEPTC